MERAKTDDRLSSDAMSRRNEGEDGASMDTLCSADWNYSATRTNRFYRRLFSKP